MKIMAIGEIKLIEDDDGSIVAIPSSSTINEETHQSQQKMMKLRMIVFKISQVIRSILKPALVIFKLLQEFIIQL
jgi:DNA-binding cell septation regulator SpoVG